MTAADLITQLFHTRSFDSVWYWLMLAVSWSLATYWTLGVGHHEAMEARNKGGRHQSDFEVVVNIYCLRLAEGIVQFGNSAMLIGSFLLAVVATMGFWFGMMFMQGLFLLVFPLLIANIMTVVIARRQVATPLVGDDLIKRYRRLRLLKQGFGAFSIFCTSIWGALSSLRLPLG